MSHYIQHRSTKYTDKSIHAAEILCLKITILVSPNIIKKTNNSTTVKANSVLHIHAHALFATLQLHLDYATTSDNTMQGLCCNYITTGHFIALTHGHKHSTMFPRLKPIYIHDKRRLNPQVLNINRSVHGSMQKWKIHDGQTA